MREGRRGQRDELTARCPPAHSRRSLVPTSHHNETRVIRRRRGTQSRNNIRYIYNFKLLIIYIYIV